VTLLVDPGPLVALADADEPRREPILSTTHHEPASASRFAIAQHESGRQQ